MSKNKLNIPADGLAGLKENFSSDALSGFLVFLLALPLSMGIAQVSDFQPIYGLVTAMVGGVLVSLVAGSKLTIKGPAAGLIVIVAGAVAEFGGGEQGWKYALGAIVVAGVLQVVFGVLKFGKLSDFFPLSAVHGMLAAIGLIIMSKQIHVLLGQNPLTEERKPMVEPLELLSAIPHTLMNPNVTAMLVGLVSLVIVFGWPMIKHPLVKKIPAALVVLVVAIPLSFALGLQNILDDKGTPKYLVHFGKGLLDTLAINVSFGGLSQIGIFVKYVIMFALVGSLEALLTVKAIDMMDPFKRKSDYNKDLIAVGLGNIVAGVLGGLPMISEVARSSANVNNGGKTRWANFFHGFFILIFLLLAVKFSDLIPKPALAAMLIGVGYKLAHPKEFIHTFEIGKEQLAIFLTTIVFTLATDLLIGIGAGMLLKMIIHAINGTPISSFFKAPTEVSFEGNDYYVKISKAAVFTNFLGIKRKLEEIPTGFNITIDLKGTKLVDHSVMESLEHFKHDYEAHDNSTVIIKGLENHKPLSSHKLATQISK
ncbi:SulP family inorganic anion transporter [Flavobacterium oreochromis]|uniref:SulP family inorganic anion transporter n=1 Tax=Flavobacterium oreochromis TaxID=2906078 RepID=UPI001CE5047F|nr:SulP family inorganic anion transporter [Flavobacterium oreochromis]QYS86776.1 SulP family inorganic anion transporter [Flavobacterium oreochromis]